VYLDYVNKKRMLSRSQLFWKRDSHFYIDIKILQKPSD
jgi:hypothetical protein